MRLFTSSRLYFLLCLVQIQHFLTRVFIQHFPLLDMVQGKAQKHSKFEAEVQANEARVMAVVATGDALRDAGKGDST